MTLVTQGYQSSSTCPVGRSQGGGQKLILTRGPVIWWMPSSAFRGVVSPACKFEDLGAEEHSTFGRIDPSMYEYRGRSDRNRLLQKELSENKIEDRPHLLIDLPFEELLLEVAVELYSMANPWPAVSRLAFTILLRPLGLVRRHSSNALLFSCQSFRHLARESRPLRPYVGAAASFCRGNNPLKVTITIPRSGLLPLHSRGLPWGCLVLPILVEVSWCLRR